VQASAQVEHSNGKHSDSPQLWFFVTVLEIDQMRLFNADLFGE
jgi:hypothetical protein